MDLPSVDLERIQELMKLMDQYDFDEIELRDEGKRLHLHRSNKKGSANPPAVVMPAMMAAGHAPAAIAVDASDSSAIPDDVKVITSPMVGTFYRAPSPDSANFVEEAQAVNENTVLCIIEAMKVMNEIKAECDGELIKILVANGEAVEYGEPLFHVRVSD